MLGDGHLETVTGKTYRLKIEHTYNQKEYVDWLYQQLKSLAASRPKLKIRRDDGKEYKKYWFNTCYTASLRFYGHQFLKNGKKRVPKLINRWLTPLTLAVWFMDDGSIKSKECQAKIINTQAFDEASLKRLQQALKSNYQIETKLRKQKEGKQIYIPASQVSKLRQVVGKYILPSMKYKLG